jgi:hypothetical protein
VTRDRKTSPTVDLCLFEKIIKLRSLSPRENYTDHRFPVKLAQTFADRRCHMDSVTDPYGRILEFLDPLLLRICGSAGNRNRTSGSVARNSDL